MNTTSMPPSGSMGSSARAVPPGLAQRGPQAERSNSQWVNRPGEVQAAPQREALVGTAMVDKRLYEQELSRLRAELTFQSDQVTRLNKELRQYQLKYPHAAAKFAATSASGREEGGGEGGGSGLDNLPPWVTSMEEMSPLLHAYDARVLDLEGVVTSQKGELETLTQRTERLVEENEKLRENQVRDLDQLVQQTGESGGLGGVGAKEMVDELNERINILMTENALMADQTSAMAKELERAAAEADERDAHIATLTQALSEAGLSIRSLEEQVPRLSSEKEKAEAQLLKATNAAGEKDSALAQASEELQAAREEIRALAAQLADTGRANDHLQRQLETRTEDLSERLKASAAHASELQGRLAAKTQEADSLSDKARKLQREKDSMRQDAEGMLQVMEGHERQIADYSSREERTAQLARDSRQKVEDALLARDQARALELQSRRELARVLEARKADAERHMHETDEAVANSKAKLVAQIESRDRDIQELTVTVARLRGETERAVRDRAGTEATYAKLKKGMEGAQEQLKARFDELQARILDAETRREQHERGMRDVQQELADVRREWGAGESKSKAREAQLESALRAREHELEAVRAGLRSATDEGERLQRDVRRLMEEAEDSREEHARRLEEQSLSKTVQLEDLRLQISSLEKATREAESRAADMEGHHSKLIRQVHARATAETADVQRRLREESELAQRLAARNTELQARVATLAAEREELSREASGKSQEAGRLGKQLGDARRKVSELTNQLSQTIGQAEARAREEGRLRSQLKRMQLDLARSSHSRGGGVARAGGRATNGATNGGGPEVLLRPPQHALQAQTIDRIRHDNPVVT